MKPPVYDPNWDEEIKILYHHDLQEIWDRSISVHIWNQYHNQLAIYHEIAGDARDNQLRILDVGCAQATLALQLAEASHSVVAMDIRASFLDYAKSRYTHGDITFIEGNALTTRLDERFDLIFANQIIEHLVYPRRFVGALRALLKPQGRLVVTTPSWHYARTGLPSFEQLGDPAQHEHRQFSADGDEHFFAYKADELLRIFNDVGLSSISVRYFETPFVSGQMKVRYLHRFVPLAALRFLDRVTLLTPAKHLLAAQLLVQGTSP